MSGDNYITKLIVSAINELKTKKPLFPETWTDKQKNQFYATALIYL